MKSKLCLFGMLLLLVTTVVMGCSREPESSSKGSSVVGTWIYTGSDSPWFKKIIFTEETVKGYDEVGSIMGKGTYVSNGSTIAVYMQVWK